MFPREEIWAAQGVFPLTHSFTHVLGGGRGTEDCSTPPPKAPFWGCSTEPEGSESGLQANCCLGYIHFLKKDFPNLAST